MPTVLTYYPANGGTEAVWTTGPLASIRLLTLDGIGPVQVTPQSVKSPGQSGVTAVDAIVPGRTVVAQALLQGADSDDVWDTRAALARALVVQPVRLGESLSLGRLRLVREGRVPLELDCMPVSAEFERDRGRGFLVAADVEFFAPNPYWREISDARLTFESDDGGFEFGSLEFPLEMLSNNVEQEVDNQGDVDAPLTIRLYGEVDTARLLNITTGETIEITGTIPDMASGDTVEPYVEIKTGFGEKSVTLFNGDGTSESIMDRLNLDLADFWSLRPGLNVVKFEADTNVSGRAEIFWRQRYSGV